MPLYEFQDGKGHVIERSFSISKRPDFITEECSECGKKVRFKRILSSFSFWGDFDTASGEKRREAFKAAKANNTPGVEKTGNSVKFNST